MVGTPVVEGCKVECWHAAEVEGGGGGDMIGGIGGAPDFAVDDEQSATMKELVVTRLWYPSRKM